jgi:hypothetical protein
MRLTNIIRDDVAERMTDAYYPLASINSKKEELKGALRVLAEEAIPPEVLKVFKKYPGYFRTDNDVRMKRKAFQGNWYSDGEIIRESFPGQNLPCSASWHTIEFNKPIEDLYKKIEKLEEQREDLKGKISKVLYSCSTTKQVIEALPESEKFFPLDESSTLPVPVSLYQELRKELNQLKVVA